MMSELLDHGVPISRTRRSNNNNATMVSYLNASCCDEPPSSSSSSSSGLAASAYAMLCDRGVAAATATAATTSASATMNLESLPLRAHSHSAILFTEFNLIREEDADILEQGVEEKRGLDLADFDDEGRRLKASESSVSLSELIDAEGDDEAIATTTAREQVGETDDNLDQDNSSSNSSAISSHLLDTTTKSTPASDLLTGVSSSNDVLSMPAITEGEICHAPHPALAASVAALASQHSMDIPDLVESIDKHLHNDNSNNDYFLGSDSATTTPRSFSPRDNEAIAKRVASGRSHGRSDSFDRRMHESAQFAESVGEAPDTIFLKKIIEEDSSSDFDDDEIDEEIVDILQLHGVEEEEEREGNQLDDHDIVGRDRQRRDDDDVTEQLREYSDDQIEPTTTTAVTTEFTKLSIAEGEQRSNSHRELSPHEEYSTPSPSPFKSNWRPTFTSPVQPPCYVDWHFTRQLSSSVVNLEGCSAANNPKGATNSTSEPDFAYRGIRANPPEITKRGLARGNYATMHRKAWLEVTDKHHRYGKNLRMYYKHWEELGHPYHMFFDWLDSRGEAEGNPLPNLPEIPRPVLDSDTVLYITDPEISETYALDFMVDPTDGSAIILGQNGSPIDTGTEGWIFVLRDHVFYGSQKVIAPSKATTAAAGGASRSSSPGIATPRQRFHHSSFFGGKAVASAGIFLTDEGGRLTKLYPHSGHYRPGEAHMQRVLFFLQQMGVDLSTFVVDMQQIFKVSRESAATKGGNAGGGVDNGKGKNDQDKENKGTSKNCKLWQVNSSHVGGTTPAPPTKKPKKLDCLQLLSAQEVAFFLAHKALMIERGVFHQIHKIRRIPKESRESVWFILNYVTN